MKIKTKILTLAALTCAFSAALGVYTAIGNTRVEAETAEATPMLAIVGRNLSLEENVYVHYAVDAENLADTDNFGMLVWTEPQEAYEYDSPNCKKLVSTSTVTEGGVEYPVFTYEDMTAKQMTDVLYCRAYAERDGAYYYSDVKKYSILEYAYNKLGKTEKEGTTEEGLKALLNAMLAYGGAAQTYFNYKTDELASDEFTYVRLENAKFEDGFDYGVYRKGKKMKIKPDKGYGIGKDHSEHFMVDEDGDIILTVPDDMMVGTGEFVQEASAGLEYTLNSAGTAYTVTGIGTCTDTDIVIADTFEGLPVTQVGDFSFRDCTALTSVEIPDSVISVGMSAFYNCGNLTSAKLSSNMTTIETCLFGECVNLAQITIPDKIASIKTSAFENCRSLTNVTIPDGVTEIRDQAFNLCKNLESIEIGRGVSLIGEWAFGHEDNLKEVIVDENNSYFKTIDGHLYSADGTRFIRYAAGKADSLFIIPEEVVTIDQVAFSSCHNLLKIVVPNTIRSIDHAFLNCYSLTEITLPNTINSFSYAFSGCGNLTTVYYDGTEKEWSALRIPNIYTELLNATIIFLKEGSQGLEYTLNGDGTAYVVTGIGTCTDTELVIPNTYEGLPVTGVGDSAFYNCDELTSIKISDRVIGIGSEAFKSCDNVINVKIGNQVTIIGDSAFYSCDNLTLVEMGNSIKEIGETAFLGCELLNNILLPENITHIGSFAFSMCSSLTSIIIPDGVTSISEKTFVNCSNLINVSIPNTVTSIEYGAFYNCSSLTNIVIPSGVTNINADTFYGCSSLKSVTIPASVNFIATDAFRNSSRHSTSVYYMGDITGWCGISFENIWANPLWGDLYINNKLIAELVIPDSIKLVEKYTFSGCQSLTKIIIPETVTFIGEYAFYYCRGLTDVTILDGVTSIGDSAFYFCDSLMNLMLPKSITYVGEDAFSNNNTEAMNIYYTGDIADWCGIVFKNFRANPLLPGGFTSDKLYINNELLTDLIIPDGVTSIENYVFYAYGYLRSLTIGVNVTSIGESAFGGCHGLQSITFNGTIEQWNAIEKGANWYMNISATKVVCSDGEVAL